MTIRFAISMSHADFLPEREAGYRRMRAALGDHPDVFVVTGKRSWQERHELQWGYPLSHRAATHALFLDDDAVPCNDFLKVMTAAVAVKPEAIVSGFCNVSAAVLCAKVGVRWIATLEGLTGNCWAIPIPALKEFYAWRAEAFYPESLDKYSEDGQVNLWALATGRRIFHTAPSIVDHDCTVPSTWGADRQLVNRTAVIPSVPDMASIDWNTKALFAGRCYAGNHWDLIRMLRPEYKIKSAVALKAYEAHRIGVLDPATGTFSL